MFPVRGTITDVPRHPEAEASLETTVAELKLNVEESFLAIAEAHNQVADYAEATASELYELNVEARFQAVADALDMLASGFSILLDIQAEFYDALGLKAEDPEVAGAAEIALQNLKDRLGPGR